MIDLWGAGHEYGVGVQDFTLYQRTGSDFAWYRSGKHSSVRGDAGVGGVVMTSRTRTGCGCSGRWRPRTG